MLYFLMGFLISTLIFISFFIFGIYEQKNIEFQLNLISMQKSSSLVKSNGLFIRKSFINSMNMVIQELLMDKKELELMKENYKSMATSISHDFRTPLTSISGYVQMIIDDNTLSEKDKAKYLNIIKNRSQSLSALVEDFYSMSSIDSLDYPFSITAISLTQALREVIANYYSEIEQNFEKISIDISSDMYYIQSDKIALERIFSNLIKNAFSYGTKIIEISCNKNEDEQIYEVNISNGIHKNAEKINQEEIFKRNYSVNWADNSKSTGLGLSIAKSLVEKSGGIINAIVEDEIISFNIKFPISK